MSGFTSLPTHPKCTPIGFLFGKNCFAIASLNRHFLLIDVSPVLNSRPDTSGFHGRKIFAHRVIIHVHVVGVRVLTPSTVIFRPISVPSAPQFATTPLRALRSLPRSLLTIHQRHRSCLVVAAQMRCNRKCDQVLVSPQVLISQIPKRSENQCPACQQYKVNPPAPQQGTCESHVPGPADVVDP